MTTAELLHLVEEAFPYLPRPADAELAFHVDACAHCEETLRELAKYSEPTLPEPAIRYLHDELGTLSARGIAWVLPSYLRHVVAHEDERDPLPTEFLIYALAPGADRASETQAQLSLLSARQVEVLQTVVEHLASDPKWNEYCKADLDRARGFVGTLAESARRRTRG
jgi:hypothetical protein